MLRGCGLCVKCCWVCSDGRYFVCVAYCLCVCVGGQVYWYLCSPELPVPVTGVCIYMCVWVCVHLCAHIMGLHVIIYICVFNYTKQMYIQLHVTIFKKRSRSLFTPDEFSLSLKSASPGVFPSMFCNAPFSHDLFYRLQYFNINPVCAVSAQSVWEYDWRAEVNPFLARPFIARARWLAVAVATETALLLWRDTVFALKPFTLQGQKEPSLILRLFLFSHPPNELTHEFQTGSEKASLSTDTHICSSENE